MKRYLQIRLAIILITVIVGFFAAQVRHVHRLDARYQRVQRGMAAEEVFGIMGESTVQVFDRNGWSEEAAGWWDETPLGDSEAAQIDHANRYNASEFFKTVSWVFTFDKNDKVVGKHRFG